MEFHEKLQMLRKSRGLTQEELAEALYVSRTAVSKWESGRGYPGIDSLKALSGYFSVTIDELLSGEKLLSIAEQEKQADLRRIGGLMFGMTDLLTLLLMILPLYPNPMNGQIFSVSLLAYTGIQLWKRILYWSMFLSLTVCGVLRLVLCGREMPKLQKMTVRGSMLLGILTVLLLALSREAYAVTVVFLLLTIKGILLLRGK